MVKHLVMWKLKDEITADPAEKEAVINEQIRRFGIMQERVPEIEKLTVYKNFKSGGDFYDFLVVMDFADREALERMQTSTAHHDPDDRAFVAKIRKCKAVVDFEL